MYLAVTVNNNNKKKNFEDTLSNEDYFFSQISKIQKIYY